MDLVRFTYLLQINWVIGITLLSLVILLNLVLTALILARKKLWNSSNILLCSKFISLIVSALVSFLPWVTATKESQWFYYRTGFAMGLIVSLHICIILGYRYISIEAPFASERYLTVRRTLLVLLVMWCVPLLATLIPLFAVGSSNSSIGNVNQSLALSGSMTKESIYIYSAITILLPAIAIIGAYVRIYVIITHKMANICLEKNHHSTILRRKKRVISQMAMMTGIFIFAWAPSTVCVILGYEAPQVNGNYSFAVIKEYSGTILLLYGIIPPLLYCRYTSDLKSEIKKILGINKQSASIIPNRTVSTGNGLANSPVDLTSSKNEL
ncbi:D(1C) dopamine receptor [Trichoplax sp. H2]|uniref:G-protein coupled receptors family 1 profile domain-containing protein n=1 Tax=Trichoplax adhaerens TaxID=10228 RepID=B3RZU1_TRIAD|nr:hypothetical protein TRIADDRAFT_57577 [Trichoplax adhaerens]EDV23898.1 hypothetical protein TRIADDRAFT_57577 [Trichoplax adhaerens]RDD44057.1 D(1C) dopamine receptor [Trichoplax sp. H2]|eukprot:XP_002113424.1 hypothetical protein TRIADDRAFT_57577 [Trichoplax adhaerens]